MLLKMTGICKYFPGVKALDNVKLEVESGSVHALMGENGAGKSTLMKCLFGVYRRDGGEVLIDGVPVDFRSSKDALKNGVAMVHQELNQALTMTVMDNLWLGRFPTLPYLPLISRAKMRKMTEELMQDLGIDISPDIEMRHLSVAKRQMVEIAKAVSFNAKVIVFDEPTSSLTDRESELLFSIIRRLQEDGAGIIYISHKMAEILRICDTVTVMRDGKHIDTLPAEGLTTDKIIQMMVGRELKDRYPKRQTPPSSALLEVENLRGSGDMPKRASFTLRRGEVLGIAGLEGSGRTELLETMFGLRRRISGEMLLDGLPIKNSSPEDSKRSGFAMLTEERRASGIFGILSVRENTIIASMDKYRKFALLSDELMNRASLDIVRSMRVKTPSIKTRISTLSGGNQQKVILGRWLLTEPKVLLLDEPTRGIDVGARQEIYGLINKLAESGHGVIVVSGELPELFGLCDKIMVMSAGEIVGEVDPQTQGQEDVMRLATLNL